LPTDEIATARSMVAALIFRLNKKESIMYKNHDEIANHALFMQSDSQADDQENIQRDQDGEQDNGAEPSHITVVPFSTTKTGSFQ
jgi:hypothetical protein